MGVNNYEEQQWFDKLSDYDKDLIRSLKSAQEQYAKNEEGNFGLLNPIADPIRTKIIEEKIDVLFVHERFYFYKANQVAA